MESRIKFLGHPVHQQLVMLPLGILAIAVIFDIVYLIRGEPRWADFAYWLILCGVLSGLLAAVFGLVDWLAIPSGTRAKRIGLMHAGSNATGLVLFAISFAMRYSDPQNPTLAAFILSLIAMAMLTLGGWLGGELVDRLAVGVDEGAHLNSPNSLSKHPAGSSARRPPLGQV